VDEYALEIDVLKRTLARLRADQADPLIIEEYAAELRNLRALYVAARETADAGRRDPRLQRALSELGFGDWSLDHVYGFVYDAAVAADAEGRELAGVVDEIDFSASLLAALDEPA
jgi:hypothetical protein